MDYFQGQPSFFVIVSGNRDMLSAANKITGMGFRVNIWAWRNCVPSIYTQVQRDNDLIQASLLIEHLYPIGYCADGRTSPEPSPYTSPSTYYEAPRRHSSRLSDSLNNDTHERIAAASTPLLPGHILLGRGRMQALSHTSPSGAIRKIRENNQASAQARASRELPGVHKKWYQRDLETFL
ncbi:hypothetical protein B0T25DRAFT_515695 [Lasiosphaeria hispida]|uniref:NYN domain-containing protein n=1 Tax=Lasiosphaeria hispida TaxID=260671 RepID=A0AAJ0HSD5_9PEZI|nr:hypothetical protein B0T25DRAFT_515695 [Lasiosphaeria hispida]